MANEPYMPRIVEDIQLEDGRCSKETKLEYMESNKIYNGHILENLKGVYIDVNSEMPLEMLRHFAEVKHGMKPGEYFRTGMNVVILSDPAPLDDRTPVD